MEKDFDGWNQLKKNIDALNHFPHPKEREIWWCRVGVNVGSEIYGKGRRYMRPVLVINAESDASCVGIPLSSKLKTKKYSCVLETDDGKAHCALVFQIKNIDNRRFSEKIYTIPEDQYRRVKKIFDLLYKI